jgi:hypothetical protein
VPPMMASCKQSSISLSLPSLAPSPGLQNPLFLFCDVRAAALGGRSTGGALTKLHRSPHQAPPPSYLPHPKDCNPSPQFFPHTKWLSPKNATWPAPRKSLCGLCARAPPDLFRVRRSGSRIIIQPFSHQRVAVMTTDIPSYSALPHIPPPPFLSPPPPSLRCLHGHAPS